MEKPAGHAFISYVREDSDEVEELQQTLEAAGVSVWRDTADLWPGEDWRVKIRRAITDNALVFIACFSSRSVARRRSYQNEELLLAVDQLRLRRPNDPWLIPVRFDDCDIPDLEIGGGRRLASIQRADLFGDYRDAGMARLIAAVLRILGQGSNFSASEEPSRIRPNIIGPGSSQMRVAEVWPSIDSSASEYPFRTLATPRWWQGWDIVLRNYGDGPAHEVQVDSLEPSSGMPGNRWTISGRGVDILAPRSETRFQLHPNADIARQVNCRVSWIDNRGRQQNTATLTLPIG